MPNPPVSTVTYDVWDHVKEQTSVTGANSRKLVKFYDAAGRLKKPPDRYAGGSLTDGGLAQLDLGQADHREHDRRKHDPHADERLQRLGQAQTYTDADGVTSKYGYDIDGRPSTVNDGKGTQSYAYNTTTGMPATMSGSVGPFSATYDTNRNISTEVFPNGMTEKYTYDATGQLTGLEYVKTTNCASSCVWYSDTVIHRSPVSGFHGPARSSSQSHKYEPPAA